MLEEEMQMDCGCSPEKTGLEQEPGKEVGGVWGGWDVCGMVAEELVNLVGRCSSHCPARSVTTALRKV